MFEISEVVNIYIVSGYTDFRMSINGLSALIQDLYEYSPLDNKSIYIFCNRYKTTIKALHYDKTGFWLYMKRLDAYKFIWPKNGNDLKSISKQQLRWLLEGLNIEQKTAFKDSKYTRV